MEKLLNPYDKEYMKMAMLKHEEIFREQVYELHRLYETQKLLMKNISSNLKQAGKDQHQLHQYLDRRDSKNYTTTLNHQRVNDHLDSNKKTRQCFDLERPIDQEYIAESVGEDIEDHDTELELTLSLSSYNVRRRKTASDTAPSFSSSNSTGSTSQIKQPTTLPTKPRNDLSTGHKWGLENVPLSNPNLILGRGRVQSNNHPNVEEQFRSQDSLSNPPWLFQVLSLNMT